MAVNIPNKGTLRSPEFRNVLTHSVILQNIAKYNMHMYSSVQQFLIHHTVDLVDNIKVDWQHSVLLSPSSVVKIKLCSQSVV